MSDNETTRETSMALSTIENGASKQTVQALYSYCGMNVDPESVYPPFTLVAAIWTETADTAQSARLHAYRRDFSSLDAALEVAHEDLQRCAELDVLESMRLLDVTGQTLLYEAGRSERPNTNRRGSLSLAWSHLRSLRLWREGLQEAIGKEIQQETQRIFQQETAARGPDARAPHPDDETLLALIEERPEVTLVALRHVLEAAQGAIYGEALGDADRDDLAVYGLVQLEAVLNLLDVVEHQLREERIAQQETRHAQQGDAEDSNQDLRAARERIEELESALDDEKERSKRFREQLEEFASSLDSIAEAMPTSTTIDD